MTDGAALLAAILAAPDDDAPRLVYADWLDEHGQSERAEFVRVQCELASMGHPPDNPTCPCSRCKLVNPLRRRERELWAYLPARNGILQQLSDSMPGFAVLLNGDKGRGLTNDYPWATVCRGFIDSLTCTAADWLAHADAIMATHPVREVKLMTCPDTHWTIASASSNQLGLFTGHEFIIGTLSYRWPGITFHLSESQPCYSCGSTTDVTFEPDPFAEEIHHDDTPVWECARCRYESARDI